jgi:threonine dehydratase
MQGEMGANVLVGIQVPEKDKEEFAARISTLGYEYEDERNNEAFMLLMH